MKLFILIIGISQFLLISCATPLTEKGQSVKIIAGDPQGDCEEIKFLEEHVWLGSAESARNKLREKAGQIGATHLRVDSIDRPGESIFARGAAFICK